MDVSFEIFLLQAIIKVRKSTITNPMTSEFEAEVNNILLSMPEEFREVFFDWAYRMAHTIGEEREAVNMLSEFVSDMEQPIVDLKRRAISSARSTRLS